MKEQEDVARINSSSHTKGTDDRFDKEVTYLDEIEGDDIIVE